MHWTPFKTPSKNIGNWCKMTHFKTLMYRAMIDYTQDHHSGLFGKLSEIHSLPDPCELQIDSFQDKVFICSTDWLLSRPFSSPWNTTLKLIHLKTPQFSIGFNLQEISFFKTLCIQCILLISRPSENNMSYSVKFTPFETIQKKKKPTSTQHYSCSDFCTPFKTPHWKKRRQQTKDIQTDHSSSSSSSSSSHCSGNINIPNKHFNDF